MQDKKKQKMLDEIKSIDDDIIKLRKDRLNINKQIDGEIKSRYTTSTLYNKLYNINCRISDLREEKDRIYKSMYRRGTCGNLYIE